MNNKWNELNEKEEQELALCALRSQLVFVCFSFYYALRHFSSSSFTPLLTILSTTVFPFPHMHIYSTIIIHHNAYLFIQLRQQNNGLNTKTDPMLMLMCTRLSHTYIHPLSPCVCCYTPRFSSYTGQVLILGVKGGIPSNLDYTRSKLQQRDNEQANDWKVVTSMYVESINIISYICCINE